MVTVQDSAKNDEHRYKVATAKVISLIDRIHNGSTRAAFASALALHKAKSAHVVSHRRLVVAMDAMLKAKAEHEKLVTQESADSYDKAKAVLLKASMRRADAAAMSAAISDHGPKIKKAVEHARAIAKKHLGE